MARYKIETSTRKNLLDARGKEVEKDILDLGISKVKSVRYSQVYCLEGEIGKQKIEQIVHRLLIDPVTQDCIINQIKDIQESSDTAKDGDFIIEVYYKKGVTDAVGDSVKKGIEDLSIDGIKSAKTGHKYVISGALKKEDVLKIAERLLANNVVQDFYLIGS